MSSDSAAFKKDAGNSDTDADHNSGIKRREQTVGGHTLQLGDFLKDAWNKRKVKCTDQRCKHKGLTKENCAQSKHGNVKNRNENSDGYSKLMVKQQRQSGRTSCYQAICKDK